MRLNPRQLEVIRQTVHRVCGERTSVVLFGSRLHDDRRGGDVDLLLEADGDLSLVSRAKLKIALESGLGVPVDLIVKPRSATPTPFEQIALQTGVRL